MPFTTTLPKVMRVADVMVVAWMPKSTVPSCAIAGTASTAASISAMSPRITSREPVLIAICAMVCLPLMLFTDFLLAW